MAERCVCCGEIIPEGRQVCPNCENAPLRAKLIELIFSTPRELSIGMRNGKSFMSVAKIADHLIAHGVTVTDNNVPSKWIPVAERLPSDRGDVLVVAWWHEKWQTMVGWYGGMSDRWHIITIKGDFPCDHVTHWMPLPEPPKGE